MYLKSTVQINEEYPPNHAVRRQNLQYSIKLEIFSQKQMQPGRHILFWFLITSLMILGFGSTFDDYGKTFYFVAFLLPVAVGTSYFFNYYLVPRYLLERKIFLFSLYTVYTIIVSFFLQMVVIFLSFVVIANYNYRELDPVMANIFVLASTIYLVVFLKAFVLLYRRVMNSEFKMKSLIEEKNALKTEFITIRENRTNRQVKLDEILYLESLSDYVTIRTMEDSITTKETISSFEEMLPEYFIRIHRSFIVNRNQIKTYTSKSVSLSEAELPISRTYKKRALSCFTNG